MRNDVYGHACGKEKNRLTVAPRGRAKRSDINDLHVLDSLISLKYMVNW